MDEGTNEVGAESPSDSEMARREEVGFYLNRGMNRRDIIKTMGLGAILTGGVVAALAACTSSGSADEATAAATAAASAAAGGRSSRRSRSVSVM